MNEQTGSRYILLTSNSVTIVVDKQYVTKNVTYKTKSVEQEHIYEFIDTGKRKIAALVRY